MEKNAEYFNNCLKNLKLITSKPEAYLEVREDLCEEIKQQLKKTYDFSKSEEIKTLKSNALPELIVKNFDLEQIWQQIELQNDALLTRALTDVSRLVVGKDKLVFKNLENVIVNNEEEEEEVKSEGEINEENVEMSDDISLNDVESSEEEQCQEEKRTGRKSKVEDDFFKLDEMERFLASEEKKLNDPDSGNDSEESDSDEGSIDLFNAENSEDEEDRVKTAKYKDFFVANEDTKKTKRNKFLEDFEDEENNEKSNFEERQERLSKKIKEIEASAIGEKPWQLKGEITADGRPQNSLLEEIVEFDMSTRPAPIITEQTTFQLEDIIRQRIKDKAFDSVERKEKPVESLLEYKKALVLNQEKSKESLAQIYENEYLEQKAALDTGNAVEKEEEEPELHKDITNLMTCLFAKLDTLSNFHFTPKPAVPELKIVSNLPAVNMEEVAPVATSDATLLAPEEIKTKPKSDILGKAERTKTDKNRERRKKKIKQKVHAKIKQQKNDLKKVTKARNVEIMDESAGKKSVKSSSAFFAQLEDDVKSQIKGKTIDKRKKKEKNHFDAKKLKL